MLKNGVITAGVMLSGFILGIGLCIAFFNVYPVARNGNNPPPAKKVIGFLPYWQLAYAKNNYSAYITQLDYFALRIDADGTILRQVSPTQNEPGWNALQSGLVEPFLKAAAKDSIKRSLVMDTGDQAGILTLLHAPVANAKHLLSDVLPILKSMGFTDLNLDIEYTSTVSDQDRLHFIQFIKTIKSGLGSRSLSIEVSPEDLIAKDLIDPAAVGKVADSIILMTYDYHSPTSFITGPVAPLNGAGISSEYDVSTAVEIALKEIPKQKVVMGVPLYGYEWETILPYIRSAVIPDSGVIASNNRAEQFLSSCASCSAGFDSVAQESYLVYRDEQTGTYHQMSFPDTASMQAKIAFANEENIGGLALWALGYEGKTILQPLRTYIHTGK